MALLQGLLQLCAFILKVCMMVSKKSKIVCQSFGHKNILLLRVCRAFLLNDVKQLQKYCSPGVVTNVDSTGVFPVRAQMFIKG